MVNKDDPIERDGILTRLFRRLRAYFLAGILVTAPISITIYLVYIFLAFVDARVTPLIPRHLNPLNYLPFPIPGLGLIIAVTFFILVGWLARNVMGQMIINLSEYIVHRLPVVNALYKGVKQIFQTVMNGHSKSFREVVVFEYPRPGIWTLGFIVADGAQEVRSVTDDDVVNVFLPTTPSPTNGILLFIPRRNLKVINMSVEDAFKLILSGGIVNPPQEDELIRLP